MGYTTDFSGAFVVSPTLKQKHINYLNQFNGTRRVKRDPAKTILRDDLFREVVGLPVGVDGEFFVGESGFAGQDRGPDVVDNNSPPSTQPGLWCQWVPSDDGRRIEWDAGEKFYDYIEWLEYVIDRFMTTWGYVLNGSVEWFGEDYDDRGRIDVKDNKVTVRKGHIVYE